MSTRRFEMVEGTASKFWEITLEGASFTVRYGRIGTDGQSQVKSFADEAKASAAAAKLVAEKTGKGYRETAAAAPSATSEAPAPKAAPQRVETAAAQEKPAQEKPAKEKPVKEKPAKKATATSTAPELVLGGKVIGQRALENAIERLATSSDGASWSIALEKLPGSSYQARSVLAHLLGHGLFAPTLRIHVEGVIPALFDLPVAALAKVLAALPEDAFAEGGRWVHSFGPLVGRCVRAEGELGPIALPPTLGRLASFARAVGGATLSPEEATTVLELAASMLRFGAETIAFDDEHGRAIPVAPATLAAAFAGLGGPHWIRTFPASDRLPTEAAVLGLAGEPFDEAVRALSMFNKDLLRSRTESPARFFAAADAVGGQKAEMLRVAGVARADHPDDIPVGAELAIAPVHVGSEKRFARLGTARLDAWAAHWLAKDDPGEQIRLPLERMAISGLPFGEALRDRLLGEPGRYEHVDAFDVRSYVQRFRYVTEDAAAAVLAVAAAKARRREAEGAHPDVVQGLRLLVCAALGALPADVPVPDVDELVRVSDGIDYDAKALVRRAVLRLPTERSEQAVARNASELSDVFEELTYARAGASEAAMRRYARLLASGRENETMWLHVRSGGLAALGAAFGPFLAEALDGEVLSETLFTRLERVVDAGALAHLREVAGKNVLDLAAEMKKLVAELGGQSVVVYTMSVGKPGRGLSRLARPAGYAPEDVPRAWGRKLMHAFTVDLKEVPELAARHPGARTLSVWIKGWSEPDAMPQAIVARTEADIAAHPITEDAPSLELTRLEVPVAAFGPEPSERARYARRLVYQKPGFLLGGPIWLQDGPWGLDPEFLAQYDERIAMGANFGDMGVAYSFNTRATWQCH